VFVYVFGAFLQPITWTGFLYPHNEHRSGSFFTTFRICSMQALQNFDDPAAWLPHPRAHAAIAIPPF
jgi:hypothetical protein